MTFCHPLLCHLFLAPLFPSFLQTLATFPPPLALFKGLSSTPFQVLVVPVAIPPLRLVRPPLISYLILDWIWVSFTLVS